MKANIDSIKEAPSSDDTWTSKTDNFDERALNWTRGTPRESSDVQILNQQRFIEDIWKKMEMIKFSFYVVFSFFKRYSLRFTLESPTSVIVHLPHGDSGHAQFQNCFQENSYYYC
ncbi:hypothetical protein F8M41_002270 [Gigaspora margarita]|uniref:Uncharacterized protein n=1 Tax=Gigaspora margarita TaxID=4874 RepID=A0A8H4A7G3_GIGMA|nr:hypothetical protein F8M41_002270 [Gigaspora margarita]